nr:immunoglobulin light chain junction region [Macaca mulatta]MPN91235.1 immunoglobulin light chain junction region [Macaca mulatta]MPN91482.1 immunoglobulin light chain junction region [Macaca mulatta]MPN91562.1 immunoglobulin light chain junction region [Macaca mulatta]MPN92144.1 immunoglobulin light chain junction region [Macaca mulatta]
CHHYYSAPHSF